jgi:mannose-1-phosphate guanylyltransferase
MKAMLLAAGRGSRLGELGKLLPKPLLPICGYPAIKFGLAACARAGLRDVVVNLHHHGDLIRAALGEGAEADPRLVYSQEVELLGTGGGLAHARSLLGDGPVLVMNAKVVADVDVRAVIAAHQASGADATLVVRDDPDARIWGAIGADQEGRVTSILEATAPRPPAGTVKERMFTGIQVMGAAIRDRLHPVFSDSIRHGYMPALQDGADIRVFVLPGYFAEHSTPARYLASNLALVREPELIAHPPGPLTGIDPQARISPEARIVPPVRIDARAVVESDATVGPDAIVGSRAIVAARARVTRAVIWPDSRVQGDRHDVVVTS